MGPLPPLKASEKRALGFYRAYEGCPLLGAHTRDHVAILRGVFACVLHASSVEAGPWPLNRAQKS